MLILIIGCFCLIISLMLFIAFILGGASGYILLGCLALLCGILLVNSGIDYMR